MRYTVVWERGATRDLAVRWGRGEPRERRTIDAVVTLLDRTLLNDPDRAGEPVPVPDTDSPARHLRLWEPETEGRTAYVPFDVRPDDRIVEVIRVSIPLGVD